jgi:hypothetical protein
MLSTTRAKLCSNLNLPSTASQADIQTAISAIGNPTRRAFLQNVLAQLQAIETPPYEGWR